MTLSIFHLNYCYILSLLLLRDSVPFMILIEKLHRLCSQYTSVMKTIYWIICIIVRTYDDERLQSIFLWIQTAYSINLCKCLWLRINWEVILRVTLALGSTQIFLVEILFWIITNYWFTQLQNMVEASMKFSITF